MEWSLLISLISATAASLAATFAFKTYRVNQQRYIVMTIQAERKAWINRINHFIKIHVDDLTWDNKKYSKKDTIKVGEKQVSTWEKLSKQKYYELIDEAISKEFKGNETMTEMIEHVFEKELKSSYWREKKYGK